MAGIFLCTAKPKCWPPKASISTARRWRSGSVMRRRRRCPSMNGSRPVSSPPPKWPSMRRRCCDPLRRQLLVRGIAIALHDAAIVCEQLFEIAFCWSHLRREFFRIAESGDAPIATEAVARIAQIYVIEKDVRGTSADERRVERQARSRPLVDALRIFFEHQLARLSGGSDTARIIRYGLRHWDGLRFLDDGRIELDTNIAERSMRPQALTRKNALFAGHDGAENWGHR